MTDVTRIISAIQHGDKGATDELLPLVYEELRLLAASLSATTGSFLWSSMKAMTSSRWAPHRPLAEDHGQRE